MRKNHGFTLVELIVVIVVISVLAVIGIASFSYVQKSARDSSRSSKTNLVVESLEKYYSQNGEYPGCQAMTQSGSTVTSKTLPGLDPSTLVTPSSPSGTTNSYGCTALTAGSGSDTYAYVGDSSSDCSTGASCLEYTVQYREETTGNIISIKSRHRVGIVTSGSLQLAGTASSSTQANLSWNALTNVLSYQLQYAADSNFTTSVVSLNTGSTTSSITGLTPGATYYYRVKATASTGDGSWSNTLTIAQPIYPPAAHTISTSNNGTALTGTSNAVCSAGTTTSYLWYANGSLWVSGTSYQTVTYTPGVGQRIILTESAQCIAGAASSTATAASNNGTFIRAIPQPPAPTYPGPSPWPNHGHYYMNFGTSCPAGTSVVNGNYTSQSWDGTQFAHSFGFYDWWDLGPAGGSGIYYWARYQCGTAYTTSPVSPDSYNTVWVSP